jgi:hypothetical protein
VSEGPGSLAHFFVRLIGVQSVSVGLNRVLMGFTKVLIRLSCLASVCLLWLGLCLFGSCALSFGSASVQTCIPGTLGISGDRFGPIEGAY